MEWVSDPSRGEWLRERLDNGKTMHDAVPHGFAAYARVFHPGFVRSLPGGVVPRFDEWESLPEAEQQLLSERIVEARARWADAAAAFGTTMHPLAQWGRLVRAVDRSANDHIAPDGREFSYPQEGVLDAVDFAALAEHLTAHTSTPREGIVGLWSESGGLLGGTKGHSAAFGWSGNPAHQGVLSQLQLDSFNAPFATGSWQDGILSREISEGPQLELPRRHYVLFAGDLAVFTQPDWILDVPWRDRSGDEFGFEPSAQHPGLVWPDDHAWVMVSEVDFDSTIVAGSAELIAAICADDRLEAAEIHEGDSLHLSADEVNR